MNPADTLRVVKLPADVLRYAHIVKAFYVVAG